MIKVINWKKFIPAVIVLTAIVVFCVVFLEKLLEWGLEKGGSAAAGAKTEIAKLDLRLKDFSLNIYDLQVANKNDVWKNLVEIGRIRFALAVNQLAFKRFIINEVIVENLQFGTQRKTSGEIKQWFKKPAEKKPLDLSFLSKSINLDPEKIKKEAAVSAETKKEIDQLAQENQTKYAQAEESLKSLDLNKDLAAIDFSSLQNLDQIKNLDELNQKLKEIDKVSKQIAEVQKNFDSKKNLAQTNLNAIQENIKSIDALKNKDLEKIFSALNLGDLDVNQLGRKLLGPKINSYINSATYYLALAKQYMPPKKKTVPKKQRFKGLDIIFAAKQPKFLIRKILVSAALEKQTPNQILYSGEIANITSEPALLGKPLTLDLQGKYANNNVSAIVVKGILDHTGDTANDQFTITGAGYNLAGKKLWDEKSVPLVITKGTGTIEGKLTLKDEEIIGKVSFRGANLGFEPVTGNSDQTAELLAKAISSTSQLVIEITIGGSLENPILGISTNLDQLLKDQVNKLVGDKIDTAKKQIETQYNEQLGSAQKELQDKTTQQLAAVNTLIAKQQAILDSKQAEANKIQDQINQKIEDLKNEQLNKVKGEAEDYLKKALGQ